MQNTTFKGIILKGIQTDITQGGILKAIMRLKKGNKIRIAIGYGQVALDMVQAPYGQIATCSNCKFFKEQNNSDYLINVGHFTVASYIKKNNNNQKTTSFPF